MPVSLPAAGAKLPVTGAELPAAEASLPPRKGKPAGLRGGGLSCAQESFSLGGRFPSAGKMFFKKTKYCVSSNLRLCILYMTGKGLYFLALAGIGLHGGQLAGADRSAVTLLTAHSQFDTMPMEGNAFPAL
ncbi:MAG TPA: hypothetical protein PK537_00355 [Candidatus Limiplasma sp.]|nr:hypothetical protein [Candidatus Limiplasma sp.]